MLNSYNQFINDIYAPLSAVYGQNFLAIDETLEEIPSGLNYCIRPTFTFGTSSQATNLREEEDNVIFSLQIFKRHDSNTDIVFIAEDIKERLLDLDLIRSNDYFYAIRKIDFVKIFDSKYPSVTVQIYAVKTGKINEVQYEDALTFTSDLNGSTIKLSLMAGTVDGSGLYYRFKNTDQWTKYDFDTEFTLDAGKYVQFKNTKTTFNTNLNNYAKFIMTGLIKASGNCNSLINYSNTLINSTFIRLFEECDCLLTAPKLPGTDLRGSTYYRMFVGCSRLLFAPELPATSLPNQAYFYMFQGCTSLLYAPELPATTIGTNTYDSMFYNCTNLLKTPTILPAEITFSQSYQNMFYGCSKIKKGPILAANKIDNRTCYCMFQNCTSLLDAPELSATQINFQCYQSMFQGCTALTGVPASLPANTLYNISYGNMFYGCTSLTKAPALPATNLYQSCYSAMFRGCTSLVSAPDLPAIKLDQACYQSMFNGCTSLTGMANMAAIDSRGATNCCNSMYAGCTSLTKAYPILLSAIYTAGCYGMFNNCSSLVEAPEIMAEDVSASQGVQLMFQNCSSLNKIKVHFTAWNNTGFTNWVNGVQTTSGTFICSTNLPEEYGVNRIPNNWNIQYIEPYKRQLDYLQSTEGTGQFIETGISFQIDHNLKLEVETLAVSNLRGIIIGNYSPYNKSINLEWQTNYVGRAYAQLITSGNTYNKYAGSLGSTKHKFSLEYVANTKHCIFKVDDVVIADDAVPTNGTLVANDANIRLFLDLRPSASDIKHPVRIYSAKIWKDDESVRNYIPVMDNYDNPAMFDLVSETIFNNQGGGSFEYGELN